MTGPGPGARPARSGPEGEPWVLAWLRELKPASVLDVGPGSGAYGHLVRTHLPGTQLTAVEARGSHVEQFGLRDVYDEVLVADAVAADLPAVDVVVLAGVLERTAEGEAAGLRTRARKAARQAVFLSVPVGDWPHRRALAAFDGILAHEAGRETGVYLGGGLA